MSHNAAAIYLSRHANRPKHEESELVEPRVGEDGEILE